MELHDRANPDDFHIPETGSRPEHASSGTSQGSAELEPERKKAAALALLRRWRDEDATTDLGELEQRRLSLEQFKQGMNAASLSGRKVFP